MAELSKEELKKIVQDLGEDCCQYCNFEDGCPKCVTCHGGEPNFPPCSDGDSDRWFNIESYLESQEDL